MHVQRGRVGEALQQRCIDIDELHAGVIGHKMTAADFAELAIGILCLMEGSDVHVALGNAHIGGGPPGLGNM
jgi:hypothetical protein